MKIWLVCLCSCFLLFSAYAYAQSYRGEIDLSKIPAVSAAHYQDEFNYDSPVNSTAWQTQKKGLHVSFVSTDESYFRTEVPELNAETLAWSGTGWKGERLNAEILVW